MADFTALKSAIQTYIKQNGNEEITGEKLQEILLSVVTTLGDSAINDLVTALNNEVTARQNADGTLQQNITNEATARGNADTALGGRIDDEATARANGDMALSNRLGSTITAENTAADQIGAEAEARAAADTALQGLIDGIKDNIENGYVYAGIATPSSTPAMGKVFYLALTAGTYTHFEDSEETPLAVTSGINILKNTGTGWVLEQVIAIDAEPTQGSDHLVKSGGVLSYTKPSVDGIKSVNEDFGIFTSIIEHNGLYFVVNNSLIFYHFNGISTKLTNKIPCKEGDVFFYKGVGGNLNNQFANYILYSGDIIVSYAYYPGDIPPTWESHIVTIPNGVTHIQAFSSAYDSDGELPLVLYKNDNYNLGFYKNEVAQLIINYKQDVYFNTSGGVTSVPGSGSKYTDKIPCKEGDVFHYKGHFQYSTVSYILRNDDTIISAIQLDGEYDITIPAGVNNVEFYSYASSASQENDVTLEVYKKNSLIGLGNELNNLQQISLVKEEQSLTSGEKAQVLTNLGLPTGIDSTPDYNSKNLIYSDAVSKSVGDFIGISELGGYGLIQYHYIENYIYLNINSELVKSNYNGKACKYTDLIKVKEGDNFYVISEHDTVTNTFDVALLNSSKEIVESYSLYKTKGYSNKLVITIPSGVEYAMFECADSVGSSFKFEIYSLNNNDRGKIELKLLEDINQNIVFIPGCYKQKNNEDTYVNNPSLNTKEIKAIPCSPGDKFIYQGKSEYDTMGWMIKYNNIILSNGQYNGRTEITIENSYVVDNVTYVPNNIRFASYGGEDVELLVFKKGTIYYDNWILSQTQANHKDNILWGKKWVACGDSFTQGDFTGLSDVTQYKFQDEPYKNCNMVYPYYIGRRNNMVIVNEALSGSIMALDKTYVADPDHVDIDTRHPFSYQRYLSPEFADADYITLWFGINDAANTNLGTISDTTNETFYGAWNVVLEYFITNYTFAKIGIVVTNGTSSSTYKQAIRDVAEKWGIPYLDMTKNPQVPPIFERDASLNYSSIAQTIRTNAFVVSPSNAHPNAKAHEFESLFIENWLRSL